MREVSLYIHVPFCKRRCSYCTFYHLPHVDDYESGFVDALTREIDWALGELGSDVVLPTVFFGGGTPSTLQPASFDRVFEVIESRLAAQAEITVEVNPEDLSEAGLMHLKSLGVNRLSVGVQSMDARALRVLKRCRADTNRKGLELAARHFANFSIDLVLGIPESDSAAVMRTLAEVVAFGPAHVSVYCLEPGGVMMDEVGDFFDRVDGERSAEEYLLACDFMRRHGYTHYEISNFALAGRESRHNRVYWEGGEYVGVGPAAHSFVAGSRIFNEPAIERYIHGSTSGFASVRREEHRGAPERELEGLMLALRTSRGLALVDAKCQPVILNQLTDDGLAAIDGGRLRLTDRGYLLLNEIVLRIAQAA